MRSLHQPDGSAGEEGSGKTGGAGLPARHEAVPNQEMLLACLQVDPDKAFAVQISHEEGVVTGPVAYMQCALLYTSSNGERRIRRGSPPFLASSPRESCSANSLEAGSTPAGSLHGS
jgi:hypothetical protein